MAKMYTRAEQAKRKCLWPGCPNSAINSHLLQKRGILNYLAENGQLYKLYKSIYTQRMTFVKVGINEALSFKGFCNTHDTEVFRDIENGTLDFSRYKSKILLNYRAIQHNIRKTQVSIDFAEKCKAFAISQVDKLMLSGMEGTLQGNIRKLENYSTHEKLLFSLLSSEDEDFHFTTIKAPNLGVAASAVHQIDTRTDVIERQMMGFDSFKTSLLFIHIIPQLDNTLVIISCKKEALAKASAAIIEANANPVKFVSDTLIKRIETWVSSPSLYFKSLKPQTQRIVFESEKYPLYADADEHISLNIFSKWL